MQGPFLITICRAILRSECCLSSADKESEAQKIYFACPKMKGLPVAELE
jgi:hypothetical protein